MVAGGRDSTNAYLSSTEQLVGESGSWQTTSSLPRAVTGVVGITLDNTLYMTGGWHAVYVPGYHVLCYRWLVLL